MLHELKEKLEAMITPVLEVSDVELIELKVNKSQKTWVLEIIAEKREGQITIDDCALINKEIVRKLEEDVQDLDPNNVEIAVSSPGLDRPLRTVKDYIRVKGREIRVSLKQPLEGKREYRGIVANVNDDAVAIQSKKQMIMIPVKLISWAKQIIKT